MKTRRRITTTVLQHDGKPFTLTLLATGIHIHERYALTATLIPLRSLLSIGASGNWPTIANGKYLAGSPAEVLDVARCDLVIIADALHSRSPIARQAIAEVKRSLSAVLKIIRSLEALA